MTATLSNGRSCHNCRHMLTHAKCRADIEAVRSDCLIGDSPAVDYRGPFRYLNWEPGDAIADLFAYQLDGRAPIHLDGEADAYANETYRDAIARLYRVSCDCGYIVTGDPDRGRICVCTHDGAFRIYFDPRSGQLSRVRRVLAKGHEEREYDTWNRCGILDPEARGVRACWSMHAGE